MVGQRSVYIAFDILYEYANISGLYINFDKTTGVCIGYQREVIERSLLVKWKENNQSQIFNIIFRQGNTISTNWKITIEKIQKKILDFKEKGEMTFEGRILLTKQIILSTMMNTARLFIIPAQIYMNINTEILEN